MLATARYFSNVCQDVKPSVFSGLTLSLPKGQEGKGLCKFHLMLALKKWEILQN